MPTITAISDIVTLVAKKLGYASGTTTAAGTSTTFIDTSADSAFSALDSDLSNINAWLRVGGVSGELRRITDYDPATQTITVNSPCTTYGSAVAYELFHVRPPTRFGTMPGLTDYIEDVLKDLYFIRLQLLTELSDGDQALTTTTSWSNNNVTLTKAAVDLTLVTPYPLLSQVLHAVPAGSTNQSFYKVIKLSPNSSYNFVFDYYSDSAFTVTIEGSLATIVSLDCAIRKTWTRHYVTFKTGATDTQATLRFAYSNSVSDGSYFGCFGLVNIASMLFPLPSFIELAGQVKNIVIAQGLKDVPVIQTQTKVISGLRTYEIIQSLGNNIQWWINLSNSQFGLTPGFIFVQCMDNQYNNLGAAGNTQAPISTVIAGVLARIYEEISDDKSAKLWNNKWINKVIMGSPSTEQRLR